MGMTKLKADQKMKKVTEKYEEVSFIHERLTKFYEFKRLLLRDNFDEVEQLECTVITEGEKMQSIVLMPEHDSVLTMEMIEDNIERLEELFQEQVKNFME